MAKSSIPGADEALAGMAKVGAPRKPMNRDGAAFTSPSAKPSAGKLVAKGGAQAGDPTASGTKINRSNTGGVDRNGAAHTIKASYSKQTLPEAGNTQANGRRFSSVINRNKPNFDGGVGTSY
jgi:hypothetical protein